MKSSNTQLLFKQALNFHQNGNLHNAEILYKNILRENNIHTGANTMLGSIFIQKGHNIEGIKLLEVSLSRDPKQFFGYNFLGVGFFNINQYEKALRNLKKAIKLNPKYIDAYYNLGKVQKALCKYQDAIYSYTNCIKLNMNYFNAYINRANIYLENIKDFNKAIFDYEKAAELLPNSHIISFNYGNALKELKRFEEAIISYDRAIDLKPDYAEAFINKGNALKELKRFEEAIISYDRAIDLKPDYAEAYWNKSISKLMLGKYEEGWKLYESRINKKTSKNNYPKYSAPLWLGDESIEGKTILVHSEQGYGDTIQFYRYLLIIQTKKPKELILHVEKPLVALLSEANNKITIIEKNEKLPYFDYYCRLMSLPLICKTTLKTIPNNIPYLKVDDFKNKKWGDRLGNKTKKRIGIVWSGSTNHENDHNRSLTLKQFSSLFELPFEFHCLQKEIRNIDKKALNNLKSIHLHKKNILDFSDTAALINQMDLIISVDTSVAHLAGGLGKKVWILLPFVPDFRWLLDRDDSPWYPTAKIFRQPKIYDWESVIKRLIKELHILLMK